MAHTNCTCGAPTQKHPVSGYSEGGACLEALKAHRVTMTCEWPGCAKRIRKVNLGLNLCGPHKRLEHDAFMSMLAIEGPSTLNRPTATVQECYEFVQSGGKMPATRLVPVTFETTRVQCAECHGPLVVVNDPDWSPDLPNALSMRADGTAWGIGICLACTLGRHAEAATA